MIGVKVIALSKNGIPIRLTDERWLHIVSGHAELTGKQQEVLDTISEPERNIAGKDGELLAVREIEQDKWLIAVYRELSQDGFIITAFLTRREHFFSKRHQLWP